MAAKQLFGSLLVGDSVFNSVLVITGVLNRGRLRCPYQTSRLRHGSRSLLEGRWKVALVFWNSFEQPRLR